MKKVLALLAIVAAAYFVYDRVSRPPSAEESRVMDLADGFEQAARRFAASARQTGEVGMAAVADPEVALERVQAICRDFERLRPELTEPAALERADRLASRIEAFRRANDLD